MNCRAWPATSPGWRHDDVAACRLPVGWEPAVDSLVDRVVLVTGAYGGLGGAVARAARVQGPRWY